MKLCSRSSSPLHLGLRLSLTSPYFSTQIKPPTPPPPPSSPPNAADPFIYLQSVYTQIKALSKNPRNYSSLATLDSLLAKTHMLDSATSLIVIDYLSQIKKLGRGKTVIAGLKAKGKVSDQFLYSLVFDLLVKDGKVGDVENVWAEICGSEKRFDFSRYVILVCKFGGFDEIKDVCDRILMGVGSDLERQSYIALVGALCRVNEGLLAKEIVKEMYDKGMEVDNWTYFVMFQCFCRNGDLDEADLVLRKLVKSGFTIDVCVYGSFLHGLCKSGKFREANKLFRKLTKGSSVGGERKRMVVLKEGRRAIFQLDCKGAVPGIMAYESYFRALCRVGKLDDAEVLLKKMLNSRNVPEVCVYGSFIKALFRAGRDDDAVKFFSVQRKQGLVCVHEIARYIIIGLCEMGKVDDALRMFEEISLVNGFVKGSNICNAILDSYWKGSRVAEAEHFFERLHEDGGPNISTCTIMFNGYFDHGDVSKAVAIFEKMLKSKVVVNEALYERLIRRLCDRGREKEAFKYLNEMIEKGHFISCKRWRVLFRSLMFTTGECSTSIRS